MKTEKQKHEAIDPSLSEFPKGGQVSISPPANVNSPYQVLSSGIDTLHLAIDVLWKEDHFFSYLASLKDQAQKADDEVPGVMKAKNSNGEWKFAIKPHGSNGYEWLLMGNEFALRIGNWSRPQTRPSVMVEIRAEALWRIGVNECVAGLDSLLKGSGASEINIKPSRVDLCADLLFPADAWRIEILFNKVARAQKSQLYFQHDHFTGFMIGGGKFAARAYDKPFEIERKSKKTWMSHIWGIPEVPPNQKIIRIEFQIRREALKELGIERFTELLDFQQNLWAYCTHKWLKFMDNPGKHQVTQRKVLPWWESVQNGFKGFQDAYPLIRGTAFRKDREQLYLQSQGLLSSLVALHLEATGQTNKTIDYNDLLMAQFESTYNDGKGETFQMKVQKKFHKFQRLTTKAAQVKGARKENGLPF